MSLIILTHTRSTGLISPIPGIEVIFVRRIAKLFRNGHSQAVRLPAEYRFEGSSVYIRRDPATGDVILSAQPPSWEQFFELMKTIDVPDDVLSDRRDTPPQNRG